MVVVMIAAACAPTHSCYIGARGMEARIVYAIVPGGPWLRHQVGGVRPMLTDEPLCPPPTTYFESEDDARRHIRENTPEKGSMYGAPTFRRKLAIWPDGPSSTPCLVDYGIGSIG